jgi:hypothetical protein
MVMVSAVGRAAWPTAKASHLGATAATGVLAAIPALVTMARGGTDIGLSVVLIVLAAGASVAWAIDDDSESSLSAMPVSAPVRVSVRVAAAAIVAALMMSVAFIIVAIGPGIPPDLSDRAPEGMTAAAVALAFALGVARRGERTAGATGAIAGLFVPAVVASLATRWPDIFPTFSPGPLHVRWWWLAAAAALVAAWNGRDVARR